MRGEESTRGPGPRAPSVWVNTPGSSEVNSGPLGHQLGSESPGSLFLIDFVSYGFTVKTSRCFTRRTDRNKLGNCFPAPRFSSRAITRVARTAAFA